MGEVETRPVPPEGPGRPASNPQPAWAPPQAPAYGQQPPAGPPDYTQQLPYGPAEPPQVQPPPRRRGPSWAALIAAMVVTALVAGGLALLGASALDRNNANTSALTPSTSQNVQPPVQPKGSGGGPDWVAVAKAVAPSVVTIQVQGSQAAGEGSGVVIDNQGSILTNNHVVAGAGSNARIRVVLSDGRVFTNVEVVGLDPTTDLAVIRIADPPSDLEPATLGDSSKVVPGQPVMAVGNPLGLSDTVTTGIVSAVDRPVTTQGETSGNPLSPGSAEPVVTNAIQTDAAINPGNSGGALVDSSGTVIGINSSIASTGTGGQAGNIGVGFAIPINEAKRIADELIRNGKAQHAILGVRLQDGTVEADGATRQAAVIASVSSGTPADKAGLKDGDAIIALDNEPVTGAESLTAQIRERAPGTKVELSVVRGGSVQKVAVTLGSRGD